MITRHDVVVGGDVVTHLAAAMSVRDFHDQVTKLCPEGTPIPSIQWLRLQFWPRRLKCGFAKHQKGPSLWYKHGNFVNSTSIVIMYQHYLREFAIQYRDYATMVSMDEKHIVKVGEPGFPVAGVERGKQVLISPAKKLT